MSRPAYHLRSSVDPPAVEPDPLPDVEPDAGTPLPDDDENDPYYYGWRWSYEKSADGSEKLGTACPRTRSTEK